MDLQYWRLCLLFLLSPVAGYAQETEPSPVESEAISAEIDAMEPSVGTDDLAELQTEDASNATEDAELLPANLSADVRRSDSGDAVMDELDLGRSEITGNQELPKVLYIVPWQKSGPGELMGKPVNTLLDDVLAPIDRSEFVREVDYFGDLQKNEQE